MIISLNSRENAERNSTHCGYIDIVELFFTGQKICRKCVCVLFDCSRPKQYIFSESDRIEYRLVGAYLENLVMCM